LSFFIAGDLILCDQLILLGEKWQMENGKWKMANGKWQMANGKWKILGFRLPPSASAFGLLPSAFRLLSFEPIL